MTADLTPREVAEELGVTVRTVQRWIADGRLPAARVGSRVRVSRSSLSAVSANAAVSADAAVSAVSADAAALSAGRTVPAVSGRRTPKNIRALLIANRGEIATRIARTARRMGIRVIGLHAANERPTDGVDESHALESYLDGEAVLEIARRSRADAIHPGYGFLAENPGFARAVNAANLTWVGPPPEAIAAMGDKAAARREAISAGIPIVPGYDGEAQDDATLTAQGTRIGYPLLVKPSAGGGGKGMYIVRREAELPEALSAARREAHRSFGDQRLILERYLEGPRHVEIQVLFDTHGNGVHLGERDCSAQRRNQKIIEESPAPSVTPELRKRMGDAALKVATAVGYVNAGTIEMLLTDEGEFFFLEMNTRLQVEHPVTEAITGRDLVEDQLRIAAGATLAELDLRESPRINGHAIEARVYAEDPEGGFLPATGHLARIKWPDNARIDTGIREGDHVGDRYDPMLAKIIAHGRTRAEALERLRAALDATTMLGVRTNLRFLRWLLDQPSIRDGQMRTDTVASLDLAAQPIASGEHWQAAARMLAPSDTDPWSDGWRLNASPVRRIRLGDDERSVRLETAAPLREWPATVRDGGVGHVEVDGQSLEATLAPPPTVEEAVRHVAGVGEGIAVLTAPMPGRVIAVRALEGASVKAHQAVIVIEAMKMEHAVVAPMDGTLSGLSVEEGQQVERGDELASVTTVNG